MKTNKHLRIGAIIVVFFVASACNLIRLINPVGDVVSEIEALTTQIPIDEIGDNLEALATEIPVDFGDIGDLGDLTNLAGTMEAYQDGVPSGEAPPDIPVVAENEKFLGSRNIVTYQTPLNFAAVLQFYQQEMVAKDWRFDDENSVITAKAAVLHFGKPNRDAQVTLGFDETSQNTIVMITIQVK
jgi:hypothetical protein